jgi:hypothetical protein
MRTIVDDIFYVLLYSARRRSVAHTAALFPPRQTVYGLFAAWRDAGVWGAVNPRPVMLDRARVGREAGPGAAVVDSQSAKTTNPAAHLAMTRQEDQGPQAARPGGHRRPRSGAVGGLQDRDGAIPLLQASQHSFPSVELAYARERQCDSTRRSRHRHRPPDRAKDPDR